MRWLLISSLFLSISCEDSLTFTTSRKPTQDIETIYPEGVFELSHLFDPGTEFIVDTLTKDDKGYLYLLGSFNGSLDGSSSDKKDAFVIKLNSKLEPVWKLHFHPSKIAALQSTSEDEISHIIKWNEKDRSVYITGTTQSSMIESNTSGETDLFYSKISENGKVAWIKHIGETSYSGAIASEKPGYIDIAPDGHLVSNFQTDGGLFDTHAGGNDIGFLKLNSKTGELLKGFQMGSTTLSLWSSKTGITADGSGNENAGQRDFAFDGKKIVFPFGSTTNLIETNVNTSGDFAYGVLDENFNLETIVHLGLESYAPWRDANFPAGVTTGDNQNRSVVVLGPNDYLFTGKTNHNFADTQLVTSSDIFVARFTNNQLKSLTQFGDSILPIATLNEEVRFIRRDKQGNIYIHGHSSSPILGSMSNTLAPFVVKIDSNGNFIEGLKITQEMVTDQIFTLRYETTTNEIIITDKQFISAINHAASGSTTKSSYLWISQKF